MSQQGTDASEEITATQNVVYALDGNDVVFTSQTSPDLYGGEGSDFLGNNGTGDTDSYGGEGADTLHGGTVADELYGDDGTDLLVGGEFSYASAAGGTITPYLGEVSGADYLDGGSGTDALYGLDGADSLFGGDGNDTNISNVISRADTTTTTFTIAAGLYGGAGNDFLDGGRGNDYLDGGADSDVLYGGDDLDILIGGDGTDTLSGDNGNDNLQGGAAVDNLLGGGGADLLTGGLAIDNLRGGIGNDFFILNAPLNAANRDLILDFSNIAGDNDTFRLENSVMPGLGAAGALNPALFRAGPAALDADDRVIYNQVNGALYYDANGNAAGGATMIAVLANRPVLTAADFVVI